MKKINILPVIILILLTFLSSTKAQQDYQVVQNFKEKVREIEQQISSADSLSQLDSLRSQIAQLQDNFLTHKDLLDKSLYPDNFSGTIAKLNNAVNLRAGDFTHITSLQSQVSDLKTQIDTLNRRNDALMAEIQQMQLQHKQDMQRLERTLAELRSSLRKRDELVMSMLGVLMPSNYTPGASLTSSEKQQVYSKTQRSNIIANIKKSIDDNIEFLNSTNLKPEDLTAMKKQQNDFKKMWQSVGPQITAIYSERRQDVRNLNRIDSAFTSWDRAIEQEAWNSVRQAFTDRGINLQKFTDSDEFTQSVSSYIDDEIRNAGSNQDAARDDYEMFVDSVWLQNIKPNWVPYLTENNLLANSDINTIDSKISQWQSAAIPNPFNWLYVVIGIAVVLVIIVIIRAFSSNDRKQA